MYQCQCPGFDIVLQLYITIGRNWVKGTWDLAVLFLQLSLDLKHFKVKKFKKIIGWDGIKNLLDGINSRLNTKEERISNLKIDQWKSSKLKHREKILEEKWEFQWLVGHYQSIQHMCNWCPRKTEEREQGEKSEVPADNFPNYIQNCNPQIQELRESQTG